LSGEGGGTRTGYGRFSELTSMTEDETQRALRRRADLAFAGLLGVGVAVWATVFLLTGDLILGLLYGLLPGVALGALGRLRTLRGRLIKPMNRPDNEDRGPA
jgi:hypothetical protein